MSREVVLLCWVLPALLLVPAANAASAKVYPRQSVYTFFNDANLWERDLFLQAYSRVMALPANDSRSFYQIGGIHGYPFQPYRGSVNKDWPWTPANTSWGGYCHHGSVLFPTWHRAYMILIEQVVRDEADNIAKEYTNEDMRREYQAAAERLRFPYWDWASRATPVEGLPAVFTTVNTSVRAPPSGSWTAIRNPLRSFTLPEALGDPQVNCTKCNPDDRPYTVTELNAGGPWYPYTPKGYTTTRQPDSRNRTQDDIVQDSVKIFAQADFMTGVFALLQQTSWIKVSCHSGTPYNTTNDLWLEHFASLEAVHDAVHYSVGGWGGQMAYFQVAGLDPIFFFHHANVDRVFALWQAANPNVYVTPANYIGGTFTIPPNTWIDVNTPLTPFRSGNGFEPSPYYTSASVRNISELGYTYPDFINNSATDSPVAFKKWVLDQYRPLQHYYGTRWYVALPNAEVKSPPGPLSVRVFLDLPTNATVDTPISSPNYAGSLIVWEPPTGNASKHIDDQVALTPTMERLGLSVDPVPNLAAYNNFSDPANVIGSALGWAVTTETLQFVVVGLDGKDYSQYVTLGEPRIHYTRENPDNADFKVNVVLPGNATYPTAPVLATP